MSEYTEMQHKRRNEDDLRRIRKRAVRMAVKTGGTVPFDLRTLIEDEHGFYTIKKVIRPKAEENQ